MKYSFNLLILVYCLIITACDKPTIEPVDTSSLHLSFRAIYDGEPLLLEEQYDYDEHAVKFTNINFYLANLVAVNDDGETELSEIQFIDLSLTHQTPANAAKGTVMNFDKVPVDTYNYLKFGIGVPAELNKTTPDDYATNHPLGANNSTEYSEELKSYIFAKIEGEYDKNGDGIFDGNDFEFAYHAAGTTGFYKIIELEHQLVLKAAETVNLDFELDIKMLLSLHNGETIDLQPYGFVNQTSEIQLIMKNFEKALQLK